MNAILKWNSFNVNLERVKFKNKIQKPCCNNTRRVNRSRILGERPNVPHLKSPWSQSNKEPMRIARRASDRLTLIPQLLDWLDTHERLYRHEKILCCPTFAQNPLVNECRWEKMMEHTRRQTERAIGLTGCSVAHLGPDSICTWFAHLWFIHFNDHGINDFCV